MSTPTRATPAKFGIFDPAPLLRQMELSLPDTRDRPEVARHHDTAMFDGSHHVMDKQIAEALGVSMRSVQRWKRGALLRERDADRLATRIGFDAALLWPDWYDIEWDDDELDAALENVVLA